MKKLILLLFLTGILSCQSGARSRSHTDSKNVHTQLLNAIKLKDAYTVREILNTYTLDLNPDPEEAIPPLVFAARYGNVPVTRLLINYGADINSQNEEGFTAVRNAAIYNEEDIAPYLISLGADTTIPDSNGSTALTSLSYSGENELLTLALENGARLNEFHIPWDEKAWKYKETPLIVAMELHQYETVKLLLENGSNPLLPVNGKNGVIYAKNSFNERIQELVKQYTPKELIIPRTKEVELKADPLSPLTISEEEDTVRLNHLRYYGDLLHEYFITSGKYPFQGKSDKKTLVLIMNGTQETWYKEVEDEDTVRISFKDFITETERVLKRDIAEYFPPDESPKELPSVYSYTIKGMHYSFKVPLTNSYSFTRQAEGYYTAEISNRFIYYKKIFSILWLKYHPDFLTEVYKPLPQASLYEELQNSFLHYTDTLQ